MIFYSFIGLIYQAAHRLQRCGVKEKENNSWSRHSHEFQHCCGVRLPRLKSQTKQPRFWTAWSVFIVMKCEDGSAESCIIYKSELLHPKAIVRLFSFFPFFPEMCPGDCHSHRKNKLRIEINKGKNEYLLTSELPEPNVWNATWNQLLRFALKSSLNDSLCIICSYSKLLLKAQVFVCFFTVGHCAMLVMKY